MLLPGCCSRSPSSPTSCSPSPSSAPASSAPSSGTPSPPPQRLSLHSSCTPHCPPSPPSSSPSSPLVHSACQPLCWCSKQSQQAAGAERCLFHAAPWAQSPQVKVSIAKVLIGEKHCQGGPAPFLLLQEAGGPSSSLLPPPHLSYSFLSFSPPVSWLLVQSSSRGMWCPTAWRCRTAPVTWWIQKLPAARLCLSLLSHAFCMSFTPSSLFVSASPPLPSPPLSSHLYNLGKRPGKGEGEKEVD